MKNTKALNLLPIVQLNYIAFGYHFFFLNEDKSFLSFCLHTVLNAFSFVSLPIMQLAGAAILGIGVWVKVDSDSLLGIVESVENAPSGLAELAYVSYVLIGVGAVLLIIGFLGCCGAVRESKCMLLTVSDDLPGN